MAEVYRRIPRGLSCVAVMLGEVAAISAFLAWVIFHANLWKPPQLHTLPGRRLGAQIAVDKALQGSGSAVGIDQLLQLQRRAKAAHKGAEGGSILGKMDIGGADLVGVK